MQSQSHTRYLSELPNPLRVFLRGGVSRGAGAGRSAKSLFIPKITKSTFTLVFLDCVRTGLKPACFAVSHQHNQTNFLIAQILPVREVVSKRPEGLLCESQLQVGFILILPARGTCPNDLPCLCSIHLCRPAPGFCVVMQSSVYIKYKKSRQLHLLSPYHQD